MPPIIIKIPSTSSSISIPGCPLGLERFLVIDVIKWDIVAKLNMYNFTKISPLLLAPSHPYSTTLTRIDSAIRDLTTNYNRTNLYKVISEINSTNSTRLSKVGMNDIANIILKKCSTLSDLRVELMKPLTKGSTSNLFYDLCAKIDGKINVSFASKFYFYANKFLKTKVDFSKYDQLVAEKVGIYEEIYCKSTIKKSYVINCKSAQTLRYEAYIDYMEAIGRILGALGSTTLNREQFDNIVWYTSK